MSHDRRTFLETVGAASIGSTLLVSSSSSAIAEEDPAFSPDDLDGLVGWYDASALELGDGGDVETWPDESGAGNDAWQDEPEHRPSYLEDGFAGIGPSVRFDGETGYLWAPLGDDVLGDLESGELVALLDPSDTDDISHLWLASPDIDGATGGWLSSSHNTSFTINDGEAAFALGKEGGNEDVIVGGSVEAGPNLIGAHWDETETKLRVGGGEVASGEYEASGDPDDRTVIGATAGGADRLLDGDIAELLYFDRELSTAERQRLESYLLAKWLPFVDVHEPTNVAPTSATLRGELPTLGEADSAEGYFEYRATSDTEWTTTDSQTLEEPGTFSHDVDGLSPQTSYEFRAVVESDVWGAIPSLLVAFETRVVTLDDPVDVTANAGTVRGELLTLGTADSATVSVEYREVPQAEWTAADDRQTLTEPGEFALELSGLTGRRIYDHRVVVETDAFGPVTSDDDLLVTESTSSGRSAANAPASKSAFDPDDGFADPAPWLDDETPVVTITEPTLEQFERAIDVDHERLVVFETSGVIDLGGEERWTPITKDRCYLAGQTAPSPGIAFVRGGVNVQADDCVIQHLRFFAGDAGRDDADWIPDSRTGDDTRNNVWDHCTTAWGIEQTLSVGYDTVDTTFTNNIVAEGLYDSVHEKGARAYGSLIGDRAKNVTLAGNIWAHNKDRNPRLKAGTESVVVNNVIYHFDDGTWMDDSTIASIVGNAYLRPTTDVPNVFSRNGDSPDAYVHDNDTDSDVAMVHDDVTQLEDRPLWPEGLEPIPSDDVLEHNLGNAGARPADRTPYEERLVQQIREREGDWIDSQTEVGGYPDYEVNTHTLNVPNGGTRAWLRRRSRQVEVGNG
ncbi:hypothetical protein OB955_12070 [Halobacteria archaeon AArc-m2/3/4]|uniref:Fibronectin type-III domain-containing protein n=1 Tax=Natronoglomus mannanivorans TaxID=2979990 RepID=A0AAP2YZQ8_9EURY|nr:hypothetical protein [Halobacteria archaeon AArc-xg1-1]MCU4973476.1 hypothetical protein [Halobacteria archaeon AArc-m2/3/4]